MERAKNKLQKCKQGRCMGKRMYGARFCPKHIVDKSPIIVDKPIIVPPSLSLLERVRVFILGK